MKLLKNKEIINGIIAGIIGSTIFLIFITPLLRLLWTIILLISNKTFYYYIDNIYKKAARGVISDILPTIFSLVLALYVLALFTNFKVLKMDGELDEKSNKKANELVKSIEVKKEKPEVVIYKLKKKIKYLKLIFIILKVLSNTFVCIFILSMVLRVSMISALNSEFDQRINIISPYINNQQEEELLSEWAMMKNRIDYMNIQKEFNRYSEINNIELPKQLFK